MSYIAGAMIELRDILIVVYYPCVGELDTLLIE